MTRTKLILIACFCAAFVAGGAAGIAWSRAAAHRHLPPPRPAGPLDSLKLTDQQREQMREIWFGVMGQPRQQPGRREAIQKEREAAIVTLLTDEQKTKYDELMKGFAEKQAALEAERKAALDEAVRRTKEILTPEQRVKYEEMLSKQRAGPRGRRGGPEGPGGASGHGGPRGGGMPPPPGAPVTPPHP